MTLRSPGVPLYERSTAERICTGADRLCDLTFLPKMEDSVNYRPVSLTSIPCKVMEQLILETISRHLKDKKIIRSSQHEFTKEKSCLTNPISFLQWKDCLAEGKAVDIVYPEFSKSFNTVSCETLIEKLMKHGLDEQTVRWIEN
ncbi:LOW QUALITY PROTEIN: hypothetical protein QYF61_007119 [Mycteria americana]|uniref:Reverse transcriptase domain-containing protein n=1 Tax=Mycteria americana TaxID=33587 RepID=A0AAN7SIT7_MYCAM|nr:LOW QUALITY PROTEIN: hypothetical protein QYF61_007119 [Mycteria americana]